MWFEGETCGCLRGGEEDKEGGTDLALDLDGVSDGFVRTYNYGYAAVASQPNVL